jgi:putative hydrolase of the HAD superfamily
MRPPLGTPHLVIFDVFNTLVLPRPGHEGTFDDGLRACGLTPSLGLMRDLQKRSEKVDHSTWSESRDDYVGWCERTIAQSAGSGLTDDLEPFIIPAIEQLHQAPMRPMDGVVGLLRELRHHDMTIAVCSNWSWDLAADLERCGLSPMIDVIVSSAVTGYRKAHPRIYRRVLDEAGVTAGEAVFVGDSLTADVEGPLAVGIRAVHLLRTDQPSTAEHQIHEIGEVRHLLDLSPHR